MKKREKESKNTLEAMHEIIKRRHRKQSKANRNKKKKKDKNKQKQTNIKT